LKDGFDAVSSDGYFKAIDDVTIIDATENPARSCDVFPSHSTTYKGVLIEYSYFELDVGDYSIRYYTQNYDDDYLRKDVSIKKFENSENSWNNNYAYWAETITYDYVHNTNLRGSDIDFTEHLYTIIDKTYELVVADKRPEGGYDSMPVHPSGS